MPGAQADPEKAGRQGQIHKQTETEKGTDTQTHKREAGTQADSQAD